MHFGYHEHQPLSLSALVMLLSYSYILTIKLSISFDVKVDWGPDGLFVGMIVGCKKVTLSGEDGTKRIRFVWKIMYADEDFESGTFTNKRTCLRLDDDGVKRPVLWFEGDHRPSASQKQFSTPVAQQHTTASIDPKAKPITALAPSRSGQVAGEFGGNSKEHGERLSSVHSVHSAHDIKSGSPEGRITHSNEGIALSRKYGIVRHEQKGLKRTSMGDEKPAIDGSAHSEARGKARSVVNGDADSSEPCGPDDGSLPLKKRASVRFLIFNFTGSMCSVTIHCLLHSLAKLRLRISDLLNQMNTYYSFDRVIKQSDRPCRNK